MGDITDEQRAKLDARFMLARRVSQAVTNEQKRICDRIEVMIYETKSVEVADALVDLARHIFEGSKP